MQLFESLDTMEPLIHTVVLMDVLCMQSAKHLIDAGTLGLAFLVSQLKTTNASTKAAMQVLHLDVHWWQL